MKKVKIEIENMTCAHCIMSITNALDGTLGVLDVQRVKVGKAVVLTTDDIVLDDITKSIETDGIFKVKSIA